MARGRQLKKHAPAILIAAAAVFLIAAFFLPTNTGGNAKIEIKPMPSLPAPAAECENGAVSDCEADGCPGKKVCQEGFFSDCNIGRKICVPGQRIGCSIDGCRFGYTVCNKCGSGFGGCVGENASKTPACTGNSCG